MRRGSGNGNGTAEGALIGAAQRGDKAAFGRLVRKYHRLVVGVAYHLTGDAATAEDVAQETFLRAWQHLPRFEPRRAVSFRAWLCRIARNRALDVIRRRREVEPLDPRRADPGPTPAAQASRAEVAAAVRAAIGRLPEASRETVVLRELEGLSYAEIAAALDVPIGTVMSRLHAARKRLALELAPFEHVGVE
jgi:RNA polymerase sigma-70 factor (ECF subfamily)